MQRHQHHIRKEQEHAPLPGEHVPVHGHHDQRDEEQSKEAEAAADEGGREAQAVRLPAFLGDDVGARDAYAEKNVDHGPAKACGEAHDGCKDLVEAEGSAAYKGARCCTYSHAHVGYEIRERVSHCEYRQADDGV